MRPTAVLWTLAMLFAINSAHAADSPSAAAHAKTVAPFLDGQSYIVVRVDLSKVNATVVRTYLSKVLPIPQSLSDIEQAKKIDQVIAAMREEKARQILVIFNLANIRSEPAVIVPVGKGGNHHTVAALMFSQNAAGPTSRKSAREFGAKVRGSFEICTRLGEGVFCGSQRLLDRLRKQKPVARPNLVKAFQAAGDNAAQVVLLPGADHRRVIAEMLPKLPEEVGGGSGTDLVDEIQWVALGVALPPKLSARLTVQSKNPASAKSLHRRALAGLTMLSRIAKSRKEIFPVDKIITILTPKLAGSRLTISVDAAGEKFAKLVAMLAVPIGQARAAAQRSSSKNNLKQLGVAMHNFHETFSGFPPNASYSPKEKKLLSWRVYLLPFVGEGKLFQQFRLNEPWDSDHNKKLIARMPAVFADPAKKTTKKWTTRYLAPVGASLAFSGKPEGLTFRNFTDGTSNTLLFVEVAPKQAVIWTKPDDLVVDLKNPLKGLVGENAKGFHAGLCDGSVRFISKSIKLDKLKALFTRNGGEVISD